MCSVLAAVSADPQLVGYPYAGLGYPYAVGAPLTYTPHVVKPVVKEIDVPVKTITYGIKETGCKNVFYCTRACQKKHWSTHKEDCKSLVKLPYRVGLQLIYHLID